MECKSKWWMTVLLTVQWLWMTRAQQGTNSGIIVVDSSGGAINTRLGCSEEFQCSGIGTRINWREFGIRKDLQNTSSQFVVEESIPYEGDTTGLVFRLRSRLIFPSVESENGGSYTCTVFHDITGSFQLPQSITVNLEIARERTSIEPPIDSKDISTYYVDDILTVGCPVKTCSDGITVQFFRDDEIVSEGMPSNTDETVYNMNLPMTLDSAGTYTCRVVTETPSDMVTQSFNITGIPVVRPRSTTQSPIDTDSSSTSMGPGGVTQTTDTTQSATTSHSVRLTVNTPIVFTALLAVLSTVTRLISS